MDTKKQKFNERMREKGFRRVEEWIPAGKVQQFRDFARSLREART